MASVGAFSEAGEEGGGSGSGGAPTTATYITQTPDGTLSAEQALSALATGILKSTTTTGVVSIAVADTDYTTPAGMAAFAAPIGATYITQTANGSLTAEQALGALATGILFSTTATGVVSILTVGSGLTLTASTLTANLITGLAGGQTVIGGTAASETLSLQGTTNGTPGKVISIDPLVIPSANSLTNTALQINGDPNTGLAQKNGADTLSVVCGGAESIQVSSTAAVLVSSTVTVTNGVMTLKDTTNIVTSATTGTKICTATNQKLGFFNNAPVVQQARAATLTNNVTVGGTTDQIDDFAGTVYATDAATIRNDIYQLARALRQHDVALRALGLES